MSDQNYDDLNSIEFIFYYPCDENDTIEHVDYLEKTAIETFKKTMKKRFDDHRRDVRKRMVMDKKGVKKVMDQVSEIIKNPKKT